jgi:hypothetical protein
MEGVAMVLGVNAPVRRHRNEMGRAMESEQNPVYGNQMPDAGIPTSNPFERLVQILRMNERLLGELQRLNGRLEEARDYLARPGGNVALGMAVLGRAKRRRSAVLCRLRAQRIEADRILGGRLRRGAGV